MKVTKYQRKICPYCKYKTYINGACLSCGYGFVTAPILKRDAANKNKGKKTNA
jgi:hypothetical protein